MINSTLFMNMIFFRDALTSISVFGLYYSSLKPSSLENSVINSILAAFSLSKLSDDLTGEIIGRLMVGQPVLSAATL
jgi:hypothetical protein